LILTILGGTQHLAVVLVHGEEFSCADLRDAAGEVQHFWPLRKVLPAYRAGPEFLKCMLLGIFQYVFMCLAYLTVITTIWGSEQLGLITPEVFQAVKVVANFAKAASCAWALTCLLLFAHEVYAHVPPCGLPLKFLSIKGIVFFTFWQGFAIWVMMHTGALRHLRQYFSEKSADMGLDDSWWSPTQLRSGLNDLLLCFEVLFFSVLHFFAYPAREPASLQSPWRERILDDKSPGVQRVLSAVNLMNISRLREEVLRLSPDTAPPWIIAWTAGKLRHRRQLCSPEARAIDAPDALRPLVGDAAAPRP